VSEGLEPGTFGSGGGRGNKPKSPESPVKSGVYGIPRQFASACRTTRELRTNAEIPRVARKIPRFPKYLQVLGPVCTMSWAWSPSSAWSRFGLHALWSHRSQLAGFVDLSLNDDPNAPRACRRQLSICGSGWSKQNRTAPAGRSTRMPDALIRRRPIGSARVVTCLARQAAHVDLLHSTNARAYSCPRNVSRSWSAFWASASEM
jgi:hypothetical protein